MGRFVKILGIDPGYAIVGCGMVSYENNHFKVIHQSAIATEAKTPFSKRLHQIYRELTQMIERYQPEAIAVEELFFQNNQKTAIAVAEARGVILLAAEEAEVDLCEYTPLQVKQSVVGYGRAEKKQVMEMTRILLGLEKMPKPDDVADALAIAICHAHNSSSLLNEKALLSKYGKF